MVQSKFRPAGRDQASRLRELSQRRLRMASTIAITSGKGGVGKSSVAVNLSIYLASKGLRTVLVDLDLGLANADLLLNIQPNYTLSHVVAGVRDIHDISSDAPAGLKFIPGASGYESLANLTERQRSQLITQLQRLRHNTDIVVLDCGAGISRNVLSFALCADEVIVVTTPQPTALTDGYATIKALCHQKCTGRIRVLVNMARSRKQARSTHERLERVAQRFLNYSVADGGFMLQDTAVESAVQERCPFIVRYPESNASACIAAIAGHVAEACLTKRRSSGLLARVAGLFL